ncbi:WxL protein peptidoglycan domain-containing protein [Weissella confusa]|uniref:DUF916 domain-containing protein n=1 Tax=Weissella confusa TaxID=1583 RepID=UPI0035A2E80B
MKLVWGVVVMILTVMFGGTPASANEMPFAVRVMAAAEQRPETTGYFDLILAPNQAKKVQVLLTNETEKPITVDIKSAQATTNRNGVVDYETAQSKAWRRLVAVPKSITLPPHGQELVATTIHMPANQFDGIKAGGLTFAERKTPNDSGESGVQIKQSYAYTVAVLVRNHEGDVPDKMRSVGVQTKTVTGENVLQTTLENPMPAFQHDMQVRTRLYRGDKLILDKTQAGLRFAPDSQYQHMTVLDQSLAAGRYLVVTDVKTDQGKWHFNDGLTVTAKQRVGGAVAEATRLPIWLKIMLGIIGVLLMIIIWLIILMRRRQQK